MFGLHPAQPFIVYVLVYIYGYVVEYHFCFAFSGLRLAACEIVFKGKDIKAFSIKPKFPETQNAKRNFLTIS
jgi:hypothetical protein